MKNMLYEGKSFYVIKPTYVGTKSGLFLHFGRFPRSCIRIRIPNTDPDHPGEPNQCIAVLRIRIRDQVPFWPLDPGSGIGFFRIPDPGSRIPYFWGLGDNFLVKNFNNSWKIGPNFFLQHIKNKIIFSFVELVGTKNGLTKKFFFHPSRLLLLLDPRSGIRDG